MIPQEILQQASVHACFFTVLAIVWRIRQVQHREGWLSYSLMLAMASLALAYLQKGFGRIEGNPAALVDVWRELSLLAVMSLRITLAGKEGNL